MGAAPSTDKRVTGDATATTADMDDAWAERAWADGVPFTLLHDDAFVAEKFQELQRARGRDAAQDDARDQLLETTGTDELPMDELERMADAARIKLFATPRDKHADSKTADSDPPRKMLSALDAMEGTTLDRKPRAWLAIERRRAKQCEIARDYMAQVAVLMDKRARAAQEREKTAELQQSKNASASLGAVVADEATTSGVPRRLGGVSCGTLPGSSLFQVASFRMQLEMLKAFRAMSPSLFENGVLSLVNTVMDFPPFALHAGADENDTKSGKAATTSVIVDDLYRFCSETLHAPDLEVVQRDVLLVLLLSLGICSGRSALLIEFVGGIVGRTVDHAQDLFLATPVGHRALGDWIQELLVRLESYRVQYDLGTLKDDTFLKNVSIKTIKNEEATATDNEGNDVKPVSIATDGSYVYTWSLTEGLCKIGTGQNFTVAGRVYMRTPAQQYLDALREPRTFQCGFYGSGLDATTLVREFASNPSRAFFDENILTALSAEAQESSVAERRQLFVQLEKVGTRSRVVFADHEKLYSTFTQDGYLDGAEVLFAFYGHFVVLGDEALDLLRDVSSSEDSADSVVGALLDVALLEKLLALSSDSDVAVSSEKELILLYSTSSHPQHLFLEKFAEGEIVSAFDQPGDKVYFSSMVMCGNQIYLSLLHPLASSGSQGPDEIGHEPRKLLRISPTDLSIAGTIYLSAGGEDVASGLSREARVCRPLFAYVTEGLRLYEVEMSAERFRVRVFGGLSGSKSVDMPVFVRLFDVNVKQIQCATFVNCFLKILKRELRVGEFDFVLPTFFTNGSNMCMLLPSLSPTRATQAPESGSRFDGFLFDCENGLFLSPEPSSHGNRTSSTDEKRHLKSFERALPSSNCCFDAVGNVVWVVNTTRGTLSVYKNSGRRIPVLDNEDDELLPDILRRPEAGDCCADRAVLKILSFLTKHANDVPDNATGIERDLSKQKNIPFAPDGDRASMERLLELAERYSSSRSSGTASNANLECLRCCLSLVQRDVAKSLSLSGTQGLKQLRARMLELLKKIIHQDTQDPAMPTSKGDSRHDAGQQQLDLRVVSAALVLSAKTTHVVDADLNSQLDRVVSLIKKWHKRNLSPSDQVVTVSLLRQLRKTIENTTKASAPSPSVVFERFECIWNELVDAQEGLMVDDVADSDALESIHQEIIALVNFFLQHTFIQSLANSDALHLTLKIFKLVCEGIQTVCVVLTRLIDNEKKKLLKIEKKLRGGLVRQLTPIVLVNATLLLRSDMKASNDSEDPGGATQSNADDTEVLQNELGKWLRSESAILCGLFRSLNEFANVMNAEAQTVSVSTVSRTTRTEVLESSHEYENSLDVTQELRIPGATQITITFDERSRTEFSYDYVTFYKDKAQTSYYGEQYYSGRDAEFNWPGVGGLPPLVIDSDHCFVYFHTDASNTDWGYKFTAVGELFEKASITQRHWLTSLAEMAVGVIDEASRLLLEGTQFVPISDMEAQHDKILHSELLRHGIAAEREQDVGVALLLREFAFPADDSDAARVLNAIERESGNFRLRSMSKSTFGAQTGVISKSPINAAIRAATAAILHHNMWGMDAYALAQNLRTDVSDQLLRGLQNAQKMRDWFHLGDAADVARSGIESPKSRSSRHLLRKQPSAYKGMSDVALEELSKNVVERANFLLEVTPMSFSYVSGAKRRWGFLAKYGNALGVGKRSLSRSTSNSTLGQWYTLLDELQEATELRSLLHYRRSSSERRKSRRVKSVTEQVLEFIQSDIDVHELRDLISKRNERAAYRSCGLWLYRNASAVSQSNEVRMALAESCSTSLRKIALDAATAVAKLTADDGSALPSRRLHFGTFLSGCDGVKRKDVNSAFGACLHHYVEEIANQDVFNTEYAVALIKAVCIDYDADDTYLLHESSLLPQLIRLLASKASRVRRSAQVLLDVFLSRLGDSSGSSGNSDDNTASLFQSQLFATVGLQLEGITSQFRDLGVWPFSDSNALHDREYDLGSHASGYTAPITKECDVLWNHSMTVWMYVSSAMVSYSLKVGDEVRRGPSLSEGQGEQTEVGGSEVSGLVTAITSPTSVRVKWRGKIEEEDHQFDPKSGKLDVVLADESIGGVVFCKGTKNLLREGTQSSPWSHFGLFLNERRQLLYRISCGPEKECVYDTNYELDCDEWAHVAIIQNEEILKFYVNGLMVTQHVLDPFLVLQSPFSASESRMIESAHPIAESADQYWPVHIPGASKIRVTFDPLSEIDQGLGFVRFYKNARCNDVWGEDKYSGRYHDPERNFPGALSNRHRSRRSLVAALASQGALEIPCDRFLVYLHHSGDATSWGFRLLATPEFSSSQSSDSKNPSLNAHPFFVGEPPARVMDIQAAKCWIYQPQVVNAPLLEDDIVEDMQASCPSSAPMEIRLERALHVVGLLQTCAETPNGRELIATPENVGDLIMLAFGEIVPVEVKCGSVVVLTQLCTTLSAEFVTEQFKRIQSIDAESKSFVTFVFEALSCAVNVWSRSSVDVNPTASGYDSDGLESTEAHLLCPINLQVSSSDGSALVKAYASLIRSLAQHPDWMETVCGTIEAALADWGPLQDEGALSFGQSNARWKSAAANITAALVLLGGGYDGVSVGDRVRCCANIDSKETTETGYLLRFQQKNREEGGWTPSVAPLKARIRTARILFDCDPSNPVNVPVADVAYSNDEDEVELAAFIQTVAPRLFAGVGQRLYTALLSESEADLPQERVSYKPKISGKENVEVLESEHPYASGEDITYPLFVSGVQEIIVFFDEMSSTAGQNDYVSFVKRSDDNRSAAHPESNNGKPYWGEERYYGDNFPGVRGAPALRIPASSVDVHFHTESSSMGTGVPSTEWGFRLTAHAYEETVTYPPESPPSLPINAINDIRARALKSLYTCLRVLNPTPIYRSMVGSMSSLVLNVSKLANACDDGRPTQWPSRSQTFESKHPYSNSVRECMTVTFSGASRLKIIFDKRTRTEQGSDYVTFFKDQSMSDRWGQQQYSGCDESSNWPGMNEHLPLIIPSDSFTLLWVTDASNVDWGWRFTVDIDYPVVAPMALRLDQLNKQAQDMWDIFYEGIAPQRRPFVEEYDGYEEFATSEERQAAQTESEPSRFLLLGSVLDGSLRTTPTKLRKFRVIEASGVDILDSNAASGNVVGHLGAGEECLVVSESKEWLKVHTVSDPAHPIDDSGKWIKRRTDDSVHVIAVDALLRNEDVLVIGVDDALECLVKPNDNLHLDDNNGERELLTRFVSQFNIEALKGQSTRYQSLAYDTHRALAIKYARETLYLLLSTAAASPDPQQQVELRDFGSPSEFLLLLMHVLDTRDSDTDEQALDGGLQHLLMNSAKEDARAVIDRCLGVLTASVESLPSARGAMRVLESRHPYPDDAELYWQMSIPGAKRILVYFDPQSKTEEGCDWVCFYKNGTDRADFYGESMFHGRNGSENWPGCGGRPPLVIDADNFEVYFHSDANQNDWGFKIFAIGVFDEATNVGTDIQPLLEDRLQALVRLMRLSLWLLGVAARACLSNSVRLRSSLASSVFSPRVIEVVRAGIQDHPQQVRALGLKLLQQLAHNIPFIHSLPSGLVEGLRNQLVAKIRAQFLAEDRTETKSEYLQMLVECALFVDLAADSACYPSRTEAAAISEETPIVLASTSELSNGSVAEWSMVPIPARDGILHLQLALRSISAPLQIKLVSYPASTDSVRPSTHSEVLFHWESGGKLLVSPICGESSSPLPAVALQSGDTVSIYLDLAHHVLVLRKNYTCVCSSSEVDMKNRLRDEGTLTSVVITTKNADELIMARPLSVSPLATLQSAVAPNWYNRVCDSVSLLLDFDQQRESKTVQCDSEHPLREPDADTSRETRERVCISGAYALEVRFDRHTALDAHHRLRFLTSHADRKFESQICGIRGTNCDEKYPALFLNDSVKRTGILKPGDRVVRSSDWFYGDEDGGPGTIGDVEAIVAWNGRSGCGIRVRWTKGGDEIDAFSGVYRYGYDGFFDVQLVQQPKEWDAPLIIPGDTMEYILESVYGSKSNGNSHHDGDEGFFRGTLKIDPSSAASALSLDLRKTKLMVGDECTIEFWISVQDKQLSANSGISVMMFSLVEIVTLDPAQRLFISATSDGKLCVVAQENQVIEEMQSSVQEFAEARLLDDQWVHIGVVFSSSKVLLYANGHRAFEAQLDQKLLARRSFISALRFGGQPEEQSSSVGLPAVTPLGSHICDVRVWDVSLRSDQIHSRANGIDDGSSHDSVGWQSSTTLPMSRKQSRASQLHQVEPPPSPLRSPRLPSQAMRLPPAHRRWVTANRTGKDLVTVRADYPIPAVFETEGKSAMVYFEAHILSSGKVCVGFADVGMKPSSRQALLGEYKHAVGLELPRKRAHFGGEEALELEDSGSDFDALRSPRRRSSSSGGAFFGDPFCREGDVVGCGYVPATRDFRFYVNGDLVVQVQLDADPSADPAGDFPSPRRVQREFDSLVDEMLSMGFSRQASEDALEATSGTAVRAVPRAVDWLIEEGASLSSPRRLSSSSPFASPRRRFSSAASGAPTRRATAKTVDSERGHLVPAATLGAQGAQGIAWNFGHRAFKYAPAFEGVVVSAASAAGRQDADSDNSVLFDVFDHGEAKWERVAHRHRVQETTPTLLARWKLDEGSGLTVYDTSGREQIGTIQSSSQVTPSGPLSPRSRKAGSCWDGNCIPPVAVTRSPDSPLFTPFPGTGVPDVAFAASRQTTVWGFRFYVIPHFSVDSVGRRRFQTQAHRFIMDGPPAEHRHDHQLIKYVNKVAVAKQLSLSQILRVSWAEIAPNENELVKWPALVEVATGVTSSSPNADDTEAVTWSLVGSAKAAALDRLGKRFKLLQELNSAVSRLLPFVAFSETAADDADARLDRLICDQRYRILHTVKRGLWDEALRRTTEPGDKVDLIVNRPMAMRHRVSGKVDTEGRSALFSQAFRQLNVLGGRQFRRSEPIYKVEFLGENAQDAGGPYRETLAQYADELHSSQLPLLIASSNAQHNVGAAREKWVLHPSATSATQLAMLEFLGKLMGAAMRSQEFISLRLALLIWKRLAGERVTADDLALVDAMIVSSMDKMRTIDRFGVTAEMFEDIVLETFTTLSTDNRVVPLKPHGASLAVTFDSRVEFADLVESYRLHEFDTQIAALRRGLATVVPPRLLSLFTGAELEVLVCGVPEVDVDLLMQCTEYSSCSPEDAHIVWFWEVLRAFSHEERSAFLRFVWGRSRLPPSEKEFPQRFKLLSFNKATPSGSADAYLPVAHTCFFSIELPRYSSAEVVREKLTYAMYNCQEIDGDGDSVAANQLGWEE